jgi:two-component system sensor histidine kinase/response regulator
MRSSLVILLMLPLAGSLPVLALEKKDSIRLARVIDLATDIYLSDPDSAIALTNAVVAESIQRNDSYFLASAYYILSKASWTKANYRLSTEYGFKALKLTENSPYIHLQGLCLLSLARTSIELRDFEQADAFLKRSRQLATTNRDMQLLADTYRERSMLLSEKGEYDSALHFVDNGLELYQDLHDTLSISILYSRKVKIYYTLHDYNKSMAYNRIALHLDSVVGNKRALGISFYYAALNASKLNHPDSAIRFLKKSIDFSNSVYNLSSLIRAHTLLADIYTDTNQPALAAEQLRLVSQYKDSLYNAEKSGQIQEMKSLYELESKDRTIEELGNKNTLQQKLISNQRWLTILLAIGIILLTAFILMLSRLRGIQTRTNVILEEKNKAIELQREEMQAQAEYLHYLNQLKSKLFSVISHDLRGPIGNLQSLLELVTQKALNHEEFMMISDRVKDNLKATQRTLDNLLNWSLSQMEGIRTERKALYISACIDEACNLLADVAAQKNVSIDNASLASIQVMADPNQVQLILRNLIHNAVKFSTVGSRVEISTLLVESCCRVTVKDSGIGMTPEEVNMILAQEHFTKRGTQEEKGTGLGLLLCKEFIKHNGGELSITSNQSQGTEISFTLMLV